MIQKIAILCALFGLIACSSDNTTMRTDSLSELVYPLTKQDTISDSYFGQIIPDPYRWLENDTSAETKLWVDSQNILTNSYLAKLTQRPRIQERLTKLWNYARISAPERHGEYYYFYKNSGLQNQSVLFRSKKVNDTIEEVFLDPNTFSKDGTASLAGVSFSNDGRYAAYQVSQGGSDWHTIFIKDVKTGQVLEEKVEKVKFSGASWYSRGFFYSRYPESKGSALSEQNTLHTVYYHRMFTSQSQDIPIFRDSTAPLQNHYAYLTKDERYLIVSASQGTSGNKVLLKDLKYGFSADFKSINPDFKNDHTIIGSQGDTLFCLTNFNAPNYRLVKFAFENPDQKYWTNVIAEDPKLVLSAVDFTGGKLFVTLKEDVADIVRVYTTKGTLEHTIDLPAKGSVSGFDGEKESQSTFYTFTSFTYPSVNYQYDILSKTSTKVSAPTVDFDAEDFTTEQVFFDSKDGAKVPMYLVYKKGLKKNKALPVFLYGYGGFQISMDPNFTVHRIAFLEAGGVYAQVNLRGGGEYGEKWHKDGMLLQKQNVFNDLIAAAEFLIKDNWTDSEHIAVHGRSNGGLLVGAVMTQRPDLFKVAIPSVGVLDMLRYHKFTIGHAWGVEYGVSDDSSHFFNLMSYSPLHNIKKDVDYPATLITTADHDDRVVPAHSFKFAATLQELSPKGLPKLIRIDKNAGHGAGKSTDMLIQEWTDIYAFVFHHLGMKMP